MKHPFDLSATELATLDLEFEEELVLSAPETVAGGLRLTTKAVGEEGGNGDCFLVPPKWRPPICPSSPPITPPVRPPKVITLALGEEGGVTTFALGEEGGCLDPLL